jgi:hypothetical protein
MNSTLTVYRGSDRRAFMAKVGIRWGLEGQHLAERE